ncbi:MAG TPA: HupE/UreJ family protein [Verrucomicrobiae bacterium]|nr:HupE/UreJ family protein [Verrucomicrobiae bacterium]
MKRLHAFTLRAVALLALLAPAVASAHPGTPGHTHGFVNGAAHPLSGLDHLLAMVAVGIFAAQRGGRALWQLPLAFVSVMALGGILGMAGLGEIPLLEQIIAASVLVFGILIATASRLPLKTGIAIIGLFALFHGYAHGAEMPVAASGLSYAIGFLLTTALLHLAGIGLGLSARWIRSPGLIRALGCLIVAAGVGLIFTA